MKRLLYFIGEPGVGKSTLLAKITNPNPFFTERQWTSEEVAKPFAHIIYTRAGEVIAEQLGAMHPTFPGTDRLSMSVIGAAIEYVAQCETPLILAEGDRLANMRFLEAASESRFVTLVICRASERTVAERRATRATDQNPTWLAGRKTKIDNLERAWHGEVKPLWLDWSDDRLRDELRQYMPE